MNRRTRFEFLLMAAVIAFAALYCSIAAAQEAPGDQTTVSGANIVPEFEDGAWRAFLEHPERYQDAEYRFFPVLVSANGTRSRLSPLDVRWKIESPEKWEDALSIRLDRQFFYVSIKDAALLVNVREGQLVEYKVFRVSFEIGGSGETTAKPTAMLAGTCVQAARVGSPDPGAGPLSFEKILAAGWTVRVLIGSRVSGTLPAVVLEDEEAVSCDYDGTTCRALWMQYDGPSLFGAPMTNAVLPSGTVLAYRGEIAPDTLFFYVPSDSATTSIIGVNTETRPFAETLYVHIVFTDPAGNGCDTNPGYCARVKLPSCEVPPAPGTTTMSVAMQAGMSFNYTSASIGLLWTRTFSRVGASATIVRLHSRPGRSNWSGGADLLAGIGTGRTQLDLVVSPTIGGDGLTLRTNIRLGVRLIGGLTGWTSAGLVSPFDDAPLLDLGGGLAYVIPLRDDRPRAVRRKTMQLEPDPIEVSGEVSASPSRASLDVYFLDDSDRDQIKNDIDKCPQQPEDPDDLDTDGCPEFVVELKPDDEYYLEPSLQAPKRTPNKVIVVVAHRVADIEWVVMSTEFGTRYMPLQNASERQVQENR